MCTKTRSRRIQFKIVGAVLLPVVYSVTLIILRDPDFLVFALGPFGFLAWLMQWIPFLLGGWPLAIIVMIVSCALIGYFFGRIVDGIVDKRGKQ